jgi:hypothetical protein
MSKTKKLVLPILIGFASFFCAVSSASAEGFEEEVQKVNTMSETIIGIISAMTNVAILPMGISSAMRSFRHIVLQNV